MATFDEDQAANAVKYIQGHANADVTFTVADGGGTIHTAAQITGKAASMGEGVMVNVLDALIKDFTEKLANI